MLCALVLLAPTSAVADPILSLNPSGLVFSLGDNFTVDVEITGAIDLYGWQLDVSFDPAVINVLSTSEGTFLTSGGATTFFIGGTLDNGAGLVDDMAATRTGAIPGVNGDGILATISFQATGAGTTAITLGNVLLSDPSAQPLTVGSLTGTSVTVIPEPGTLMLLLSGLMGLAALGRAGRGMRG
jgi:hypothetical protein